MVIGFDCGIKSQLVRLNTNHGVLLTLYSFEDLGEHMMVAHIKTFSNIEFEKKHPRMERPNVESTPYISTTTDWWLKLRPIPPPECKDFAEQVMASLSALSISLKNLEGVRVGNPILKRSWNSLRILLLAPGRYPTQSHPIQSHI